MSSLLFGLDIRTVVYEDTPYFYLLDVTRAIGTANPLRILKTLDADEQMTLDTVTNNPADADTVLVTEPAIYRMALSLRRPAAKALLRWVCHQVLPSLRASNRYTLPARRGVALETSLLHAMRGHLDAIGAGVDQSASTGEA
jgi:prophage antirepressor-like protein